ncbi:hypothetical protein ACOMHN_039705 [Nucella lapillus]
MVVGYAAKPAALVAGALTSPGTLNTVVLFTVVAVAELLLNDAIFSCPCHPRLALAYGLSFLFVPAIILLLADFPWKLLRKCPSGNTLCSLVRRPIGLAVTWIIIGTLQRRYMDCILGEWTGGAGGHNENRTCEDSVTATSFQLAALYVWLVIIVCTFMMVLCRRRKASCISGRSAAMEMQIDYEIQEKLERVTVEKKMKYGVTETERPLSELSEKCLNDIQPGLTDQTYHVLKSEQLLQPSVLRFLRSEDLFSLDVSIAQRCLLRSLLDLVQQDPKLCTMKSGKNDLPRPTFENGGGE